MSTSPLRQDADIIAAGFQPMPELSPEEYAALKEDIAEHGILYPVIVDQHGRILDGHNRAAIAAELGIDCPQEVRHVVSDDDAWDIAFSGNKRRHLTREQQREVIAREIARCPGDSDRKIAKRIGCSPSTVGTVRKPRPKVSKLDTSKIPTWTPPELTDELRQRMVAAITKVAPDTFENLRVTCEMAIIFGASPDEVLAAVTQGNLTEERKLQHLGDEYLDVMRSKVWRPLVQWLINPDPMAMCKALSMCVEPMPPEIKQLLLDQLAGKIPNWLAGERGLDAWLTEGADAIASQHGYETFADVAAALIEIRDKRLYRDQYKTFEDYCCGVWGIPDIQLIEIAEDYLAWKPAEAIA